MTKVYQKSLEIITKAPEECAKKLPQTTDDLTKIKGIGSGTAEKLNTRRIYTYLQLAEITPEKLSEAPGISITTAKKFIEEAKNFLGQFQEQNSINKQDQIIEKTTEILKKEKNPEVDSSETFEVAEVIVEEELPQEKSQIEEKPDRNIEKQWFRDKFNRSRLTASYPPILKRSSKESKEEIEVDEGFESKEVFQQRSNTPYKQLLSRSEEEIENSFLEHGEIETEANAVLDFDEEKEDEVEKYQEQAQISLKKDQTVESFENEISVPDETNSFEETVNTPIYPDFSEVIKVPEVPKIREIPENLYNSEIPKVPTILRVIKRREEKTSEITESLKNLGYYSISSGIEALKPFFQNIDYIGLKLISVKNNSKLILLLPIKFCDLEGTILVNESKIDFKTYSKAQKLGLANTARHYAIDLLKAKNDVFEDIVNGERFRNLFEKILQVRFTTRKSANNKKLYFSSGQTQYKVIIEPILLTRNPAKCMEKSILFPYQRKTNLHVIDRSNIANLLRFLEKKYQLIESHTKKNNSIGVYQNADTKFRSSLKIASIPFLGYSVVLFFIYFSQFYFLLRLFNSVGFAVIGVYFFAIVYFYFRFYKTKKELTTEFKTPYYLQNLRFSETDLLCVKEEFTVEQMAQFGYECFGKDNNIKVLEQLDKERIKESVGAKQLEREVPHLYEMDSGQEFSSVKNESRNKMKYSSFLED